MRRNFIGRDYARGVAGRRGSGAPTPARPSGAPSTSTGPGPAPISRRPSRTASEAIARAARAASSGLWPSARWAASALECVQPEPWAAPSGWRVPLSVSSVVAVEEDVGDLLAVAAGDDDRVRAEAVQRPRERRGVILVGRSPASTRASGRFGVITVARGSRSSTSAGAGVVVEQHRAGLGDHHRVDHDRRAGLEQVERLADGVDGLRGAEHADLDGVDADVASRPAGPARRSSPAASRGPRSRRSCSAR